MTVSAQNLLNSTTELCRAAQTQSQEKQANLSEELRIAFQILTVHWMRRLTNIETALNATQSVYDEMNQTITKAFEAQSQDTETVASTLDTLATKSTEDH